MTMVLCKSLPSSRFDSVDPARVCPVVVALSPETVCGCRFLDDFPFPCLGENRLEWIGWEGIRGAAMLLREVMHAMINAVSSSLPVVSMSLVNIRGAACAPPEPPPSPLLPDRRGTYSTLPCAARTSASSGVCGTSALP